MKATIYFTYQLKNISGGTAYRYNDSVHCNYINNIEIDSTVNKEITVHFDNIDEFKFLSSGSTNGTGFTATNICLLIQRVYSYETLASDKWLSFDVTNQISGFVSGNTLTPSGLTTTNFKINLVDYNKAVENNLATIYNLNYLNYPISTYPHNEKLSFGDEEYFLGNIECDIEATIHAMNISIPTTGFGQTNNLTWKEGSPIYVTEVGIYDDNKNLVGIAKLNSPIDVSNNNTIIFGLDF